MAIVTALKPQSMPTTLTSMLLLFLQALAWRLSIWAGPFGSGLSGKLAMSRKVEI
ncbi:hypothetical protein HID58_018781 [Brassica napus]|uniref:Uncharacterized protein n=1 Tax=Brassica napus TaxID=3708 RepID=A0ABQ8DAV1_BRANA|nr:hypothetical protein HID58_018781 [Brassica napus]